jgi:hypothetical protein
MTAAANPALRRTGLSPRRVAGSRERVSPAPPPAAGATSQKKAPGRCPGAAIRFEPLTAPDPLHAIAAYVPTRLRPATT